MVYWDKLSALSPSQSSHTILSVAHRCNFFMEKMHENHPHLHLSKLLIAKIIIVICQYAFSPLDTSSQFFIVGYYKFQKYLNPRKQSCVQDCFKGRFGKSFEYY